MSKTYQVGAKLIVIALLSIASLSCRNMSYAEETGEINLVN